MKRALSLILSLLCTTIALAQHIKVEGRLVDAVTGERLPYVKIQYKANGQDKMAIANSVGDFSFQADPDGIVHFSFIGYEKHSVKASKMPRTVRLSPWTHTMGELTVTAHDPMPLLLKINKQLKQEHSEHKKEEAQYFMRMLTTYKENSELVEAFLTARSMGHLRDIAVVRGRYGWGEEQVQGKLSKKDTQNFHHILELGPWFTSTKFWPNTTSPLNPYLSNSFLKKHYAGLTLQEVSDSTNGKYYVFVFKRSFKYWYDDGIVTGKLYVDANTLHLLRFEGEVQNIFLTLDMGSYRSHSAMLMYLRITFDHSKGYTEVSNMDCTMISHGLNVTSKCVLYNVDDIDLSTGLQKDSTPEADKKVKGMRLDENLLGSVQRAGYDETLWEKSNIMKRTDEEMAAMSITSQQDNEATNQPANEATSQKATPWVPRRIAKTKMSSSGQGYTESPFYKWLESTKR